ncbi:trypsin-like peptidase domain-containing protein [Neobacillus sp. PS3-12]|uniref:S1C family serine protease n=1 Tax=Neobacillus sp. PS3-12 TaxID=3070677 RepID=UPI0027E17D0F|nr:trypsin-like peptidase domain-containing protein [Neobacillus sp. PS3-12]WML55865.1 trypsin-like peptidase domain-containing protein [Neobacillus sp. PS3-12]
MDFNDRPKYENSSNTENTSEKTYTYENGAFYQNDDYSRYDKMNGAEKQRSNRKGNFRGILGAVAAGVVGSALTLAVLPHTDYFKNIANENNETAAQQVSTNNAVKTVSAKPSTTSGTGSIADTVDRISKTIVGIVNYQQQSNNANNLFGNGSFGSSNGFGSSDNSGNFGNSGGFGSFGNSGNDGASGNNKSNSVETGSGSGVIFQKSGDSAYIVTNNHVVEGASKLEVSLYSGQKTTATVVGTDALTDLAVLKIDSKYVTSTAEFGDSSVLRPGDEVLAIGNPLGLDLSRTVTQGIVSATNRSIAVSTSAGDWETNVIQTDAAINPGNSGGALINTQGQVVGINSLKISETGVEGLGFAIPSNDLIPIVNQLIKNGKVERPYLGVGLADLSEVPQMYWNDLPNNVQKGVMITNIDPQSVAANSGLKQRDVVVSMNGTDITSSTDLRKYLYTKVKIGDTVKFGIYRNGKLMNIDVKLTAKAAN